MDDAFTQGLRSKLAGLRSKRQRDKNQQQVKLHPQQLTRKQKPKKSSKFGPSKTFKRLRSANPFLDLFHEWKLKSEHNKLSERIFAPDVPDWERAKFFSSLPLDALNEYAWAIPDARALKIMKEFAPLIEIGCGKGYWCRLLREMGVDIVGYDKNVPDTKDAWTQVEKGDSKSLSNHQGRTLFLCYPDDFEGSDVSLAAECLEHYKGETVILVGEWLGQTVLSNPCGKSISIEAQLELSSKFHLLLSVPLPSFPTSSDSLTVWRRTRRCQVDDEWEFADIPEEERISLARACSAYSRFLEQ